MAKIELSKAGRKEAEALFARYPKKVHALLPVLHIFQRENEGWLPEGCDQAAADLCEVPVNHVREVITFYNMFKQEPVGRNHILVCTSPPCGLCGGPELLELLEDKLGVVPGKTTTDGLFSLEEAQCLAACDQAPLMKVNGELHGRVTEEGLEQWIAEVRGRKAGSA